jgi:hypothetical protein
VGLAAGNSRQKLDIDGNIAVVQSGRKWDCFLHNSGAIRTEINPQKPALPVQYSVATEEKSFREESETEASQRIGDETHFRQLKTVGRKEALTTRGTEVQGCAGHARGS